MIQDHKLTALGPAVKRVTAYQKMQETITVALASDARLVLPGSNRIPIGQHVMIVNLGPTALWACVLRVTQVKLVV